MTTIYEQGDTRIEREAPGHYVVTRGDETARLTFELRMQTDSEGPNGLLAEHLSAIVADHIQEASHAEEA